MRRFKIIVCSILLLITLVSCGTTESTVTTPTPDIDTNTDYFVEVENYGRTISLSEPPSKVLTLGPNCTELFVALGLGDKVIGRSLANHSRGALPEYAAEVNAIPELNHAEVTRESILTSGADFIYAIDWEISDIGCNIEEVESYGMNVYVNNATTLEELYKEIEDIGKIFGVEETAQAFINDQKTRIEAVTEKVEAEKAKNGKVLKVLVYDSGNDGVFTASGSNFESVLISLAGGKNMFSHVTDKQWITVSYEEVLKQNPDIILIHDYDTFSVDEKIAEIKKNPVLSDLDCVKNNRFTYIDLESVLPGNRVASTVEKLAKDFYPEAF